MILRTTKVRAQIRVQCSYCGPGRIAFKKAEQKLGHENVFEKVPDDPAPSFENHKCSLS